MISSLEKYTRNQSWRVLETGGRGFAVINRNIREDFTARGYLNKDLSYRSEP